MNSVNELELLQFKQNLRSIIIKIIIGGIIGIFLGVSLAMANNGTTESIIGHAILLGIIFGGFPYTYSLIPISFFNIIGTAIKFAISLMVGWAITPIALIYNLIQYKRYQKKVENDNLSE